MTSEKHALIGAAIGAVAAVAPDAALATFAWRHDWVPETHPMVRLHRLLHSPHGLIVAALVAWASHIVVDWHSPHNQEPRP